ncbi:MAG: DNA-binding protein Alba [Promethearchaeati archaeon SRVP18_Atabeyarchaeia-1]
MPERSRSEENAVLVGTKPPMNYVLAVITLFHDNAKLVSIKARGQAISRAVDVAEIVRNRFMSDVKVKEIITGTEQLTGEQGNKFSVSTIEISLTKE